jgi:hypothetical protein
MADDSGAPKGTGWLAIDRALFPIYRGIEPMHWGPLDSWRTGGHYQIDAVSAYRNNRSRNHLHYVTYGFSELWESKGGDPHTSGFGSELTFRLAWNPVEPAPDWVVSFLQKLCGVMPHRARWFAAGRSMSLNGPIVTGFETQICAIAFTPDPELSAIETDNGRVRFLQIVGLTQDEHAAIQEWSCTRFLEFVAEQNELLITDLDRDSYLFDELFASRVNRATEAEGSSTTTLFCDQASFVCVEGETCRLTLGAFIVSDLARRLLGTIPFDRPFALQTYGCQVTFEPADHFAWGHCREGVRIQLTARHCVVLVGELRRPDPGTYTCVSLPGLTVTIEKTRVKDRHGNVVGEIG